MIAKVVGYQGFQSYGDLAYPSLKPGRRTLDSNEVWEKTVRENDKVSFYNNTNYHYSSKQTHLDSTVNPAHFKGVYIVKKVNSRGEQGNSQGSSKGVFTQTANSTLNNLNGENQADQLVQTGVEHWKSVYQSSIVDPYTINKATRPEWTLYKPPYQVDTQGKVGPSEYKTTMGELGSNPLDKVPDLDPKNPRGFDELRLGTTQASMHPPGYTGFIPSVITASKATIHGQGLEPKKDFMKTNLKDNYHTKIPGYAGHIPRSVINQRDLPQSNCLGSEQKQEQSQ